MRELLLQKPSWLRIALAILSAAALFTILLFAYLNPAVSIVPDETSPETAAEEEEFEIIIHSVMQQLEKQEQVDQDLLDELASGLYSLENPLVVNNPYGISPLTALILFTSAEPLKISVQINGIDEISTSEFSFDSFNTEHIIPIYGLYPGKENTVIISSEKQSGISSTTQLEINTEPLPQELSDIIILTDFPMKEHYQHGLNLTYENNGIYSKTAFDAHGNYRWYLIGSYRLSTGFLNNRFIFAKGANLQGDVIFIETNPLGRIYSLYFSPYGVHHDIEAYHGNLLVSGSEGETIEDFIYEINIRTGEIENTLDLKTILQRSRQGGMVPVSNRDWFHHNATEWVEDSDRIIISGRHQSAVVKLSWPDGDIDWILADHSGWLPMFEKYLLTPLGENFEWSYAQHAPIVLPDFDQNPNTIDILLFDNGNLRFENDLELQRKISNNEVVPPELYSRMVHYRIDEVNMTVEQIWQFGKEIGNLLYASGRGNASLLPNGNRIASFDTEPEPGNQNATFVEVTEQSDLVWMAHVISKKESGKHQEYRLSRLNIYNEEANNLQIGSPVINLIPREVLQRYAIEIK